MLHQNKKNIKIMEVLLYCSNFVSILLKKEMNLALILIQQRIFQVRQQAMHLKVLFSMLPIKYLTLIKKFMKNTLEYLFQRQYNKISKHINNLQNEHILLVGNFQVDLLQVEQKRRLKKFYMR